MAVAPIVKENYWYYNNGSYELESTVDAKGNTTPYFRNITGPAPINEIQAIVKGISPSSLTWKTEIVTSLTTHKYNTQDINDRIGVNVGLTVIGYIKYKCTLETATKIGIFTGGAFLFIAAPGLVAKLAPQYAQMGGLPALEGTNFLPYLAKSWKFICSKLFFSNVIVTSISAYTIQYVGKKLYDAINRDVGPNGFRAWKTAKLDIVIREKETMLPKGAEKDTVLSQNRCAMFLDPIRIPCKTIHGHIFEEAVIKGWLSFLLTNNKPLTCPLGSGPLKFTDLTIDKNLSDTIELRVLLLNSI